MKKHTLLEFDKFGNAFLLNVIIFLCSKKTISVWSFGNLISEFLFIDKFGKHFVFEGSVFGKIIDKKRGDQGFGYDPLFIPDGYDKTFAEMSIEEKSKLSHRARALEKFHSFLVK